jgi:hypothetical protein
MIVGLSTPFSQYFYNPMKEHIHSNHLLTKITLVALSVLSFIFLPSGWNVLGVTMIASASILYLTKAKKPKVTPTIESIPIADLSPKMDTEDISFPNTLLLDKNEESFHNSEYSHSSFASTFTSSSSMIGHQEGYHHPVGH